MPQRIRKDFQIEESEVESPEKEILRSAPILGNSPTPVSPLVKDFPSPAPLVLTPVPPVPLFFTPPKSQERSEMPANIAEEISAENVVALEGSESDLEKLDESEGSESEGSESEGSESEGSVDNDEFAGKSELSKLKEVAEMSDVENVVEVEDEERRKTERVKVLCDYEALFSHELTIKKGDLIDLVNDDDNNGWWKGKVGGKEGYFLAAYVEKI